MKTIITSQDGARAQAVRDALLAADSTLRCELLVAGEPVPLCALLVQVAPAPTASAASAPLPGTALRWAVTTSSDPAMEGQGFDLVIAWPTTQDELARHLAQARATLRARRGLAQRSVLDQALARVVELASESIEVVDPSIRLLYANPAFEQVTGWAMEDAVGFTTGELFRAGTHDPAYYAGIGATLRAGGIWRGPLVARRRDGVLSFQEATLAPVTDEAGKTIAFVAIKRDAERDMVAQSAGASSGTRLQTMIEDAADAFLVHDALGHIVDANTRACRMLGCTRAELLAGRRVQEFVPAKDASRMAQVFNTLSPGDPQTLETRFLPIGGDALPVDLRVGVFSFGGERFVLTLARDISERVALEAALRKRSEELSGSLHTLQATQRELVEREKHAALGTLVAGVAHDINTPLGVTLTALSLAQEQLQALRSTLDDPRPSRQSVRARMADLEESFNISLQNARRAAGLIADFKKIAVDQASEVLRNIELVAYVRSVAANFGPALRRARVDVDVSGDPIELMTRPGAIAQVITNLLQNALVHAFEEDDAHRRIRIECAHDDRRVHVRVADNGKGMGPEVAARIFDPFFTTRMGSGGSGLGMTIVHNLIVEALQGAVSIRTAPGEGLEVSFSLPRHPARATAGDPHIAPPARSVTT